MRKAVLFLLVVLILLTAGCTDRQNADSEATAAAEHVQPATEVCTETQARIAETESETDPPEEELDVFTGATPTVPEGMCVVCGLDWGDYDGYCYYCHPDFLFTCVKCGYEQPYHRPENGLCHECAAAEETVDAYTGATA